jgi:hypothetical protein
VVNVIYTLTLYAALYRGGGVATSRGLFFGCGPQGTRSQVMQTVRLSGRLSGAMEGSDDVSAEVNMGVNPGRPCK